ncbi:ABC transporter substrate-binding protein [Entomospira entomophila]|uniref:ABC transporter substrate-binding protein n=1 Tax=Entomospira entomophila TaxID=2719988 RepID=A0A968G7Q3_9SPIO|nr:ABC transporter substrate-binding protein [Entomospira entomophilus]NIZ40113.1 ABC transporter substrate-binding protein [Entomospira entomophilus]WDI35673.1 ABC transporter substrate-binding protein [Entomospira entomophilus]
MMKMIKGSIGLSLILVMLTVSCVKNSDEKNATDRQTLKLAIGYIPNMQFAPLYVGIQQGMFHDVGLDLEIDYGMGNDIMTLLAKGYVDLALGDADQYLAARQQGLDLTPIFQYYDVSPTAIITLNPDIKTPSDLIGRRIGVSELFGTSYLTLLEFLDFHNIERNQVEIVRVGYTQLAALTNHEVDAAVVFANNEPLALKNIDYTIWSSQEFSRLAGAIILQKTNTLSSETAIAFNQALVNAIDFIRNNPEAAATITQKFVTGSNYNEILAGIYATIAFYSESGVVDFEGIEFSKERLLEMGALTGISLG